MTKNLTEGKVLPILISYSIPYLFSCFLQTFYGLADLFIIGAFNGANEISAVSIGSQLMHMFTVVIAGLAMGTTVGIGRSIGAGEQRSVCRIIGSSITVFTGCSIVIAALLIACLRGILLLVATPAEAFAETYRYALICFAGIPFISAYNVLGSVFRGAGDTKSPLLFVLAAGILNIFLDWLLIGALAFGASGAALATVISQGVSVLIAAVVLKKAGTSGRTGSERLFARDFVPQRRTIAEILKVGLPIASQDGLIQVSFLVITAIANSRGVIVAASVGIVEKIICFLFLVPSAMLTSVSAIAAQNAGASKHERGTQTLRYALLICIGFGAVVSVLCNIAPERIIALFSRTEPEVVRMGAQYLRAYVTDCMLAGIHFCFSGYFCAYGKSLYSFLHNIISIALVRIPGVYLASRLFPQTLLPMGAAAPLGSLLSAIICAVLYAHLVQSQKKDGAVAQ